MKKRTRILWKLGVAMVFLLLAAVLLLLDLTGEIPAGELEIFRDNGDVQSRITTFAEENGLPADAWPEELTALLEKEPEAEEFVLNYPLRKGTQEPVDLSEYEACGEVPLLMQWDTRWGYAQYGDAVMGLSGCGPTCLSMVCIFLLGDTKYDPGYLARFSEENGYCVPGSGSAWTLISEGGVELGLDVVEIPLDRERLFRNLEVGNPVICVMGPGDFTATGHFVVMTALQEGMIKINDPNSVSRSEQLWDYDRIRDQIQNLWVCRLP